MKYFVLSIAILVVLSGCSSTAGTNETTNGANPSAPNTNPANANTAAATNSGSTGLQPYNGMQNVNPNAFNASNDNLKVIPVKPVNNQAGINSRSAPDDSTITSGSRGLLFFEARTFNSHPVLAKVEKIMDGKTEEFKVYLKNGQVVDAPADKMTNYAAIAPANIIEIIGMAPTAPTSPPVKPEAKKDEKPQ